MKNERLDKAMAAWVNGDYRVSVPVIEEYAIRGDCRAQHIMGLIYSTGSWGRVKNMDEAEKWFERSARSGYPMSALLLAFMYDPENPVSESAFLKSAESASKYYKLAFDGFMRGAENGDPESMNGLADCYLSGWGVEPDVDLYFKWKENACDYGFAPACSEVGK